jgi:EAL domain-containing protein (putative c-di-GMP-specific phosphodiesterase class I)
LSAFRALIPRIRNRAPLPDLSVLDTLCINLSGRSIGDRAFHRHVIDLARIVNVRTAAGYFDRPGMLDRVREPGIDFAQGLLQHLPEPIEDVFAMRAPPAAVATRLGG